MSLTAVIPACTPCTSTCLAPYPQSPRAGWGRFVDTDKWRRYLYRHLSRPPLQTTLKSWLADRAHTLSVWAATVWMQRCSPRSHSLTVQSEEAVSAWRPSWLSSTPLQQQQCPGACHFLFECRPAQVARNDAWSQPGVLVTSAAPPNRGKLQVGPVSR